MKFSCLSCPLFDFFFALVMDHLDLSNDSIIDEGMIYSDDDNDGIPDQEELDDGVPDNEYVGGENDGIPDDMERDDSNNGAPDNPGENEGN